MMTKHQALGLGTGWAVLFLAAAALAQSDNFNDNNDDGWIRMSPLESFGAPGTFTVANGQYRIQAPASPNPGLVGPGRAGSMVSGDSLGAFRISVDLVTWDDSLDQAFGILARVREPGLGTLDGYALTYVNEQGTASATVQLLRLLNEADTGGTLATHNIRLLPNVGYRLVLTGIGSQLTGEVYALTNLTTPLVTLIAVNAEYTSGTSGLFVYDNSSSKSATADATFDNFIASPPPAQLQVLSVAGRTLTLAWPDWGNAYQLQWRTNATTGTWNLVTDPFTYTGGLIRYSTDMIDPARYYRLSWAP